MNSTMIHDSILTACCIVLIFVPFDTKRIRARWAKFIFFLCGIIGIARGAFCLTWDLGWFSFAKATSLRLDDLLYYFAEGLIVGLVLALIFSGQLAGRKHPPNTALEPTPTAP